MTPKQKRWRSIGIMVAALVAAYFINVEVQTYLGQKALEKTGFQSLTLAEAKARASAEDKLVLVDVSAIWCPTCRRLDQKVFAEARVQKAINRDYVFARLEYESDSGQAFLQKYGLSGFPNLVILKPDGTMVRSLPLTFSPDSFMENL